MCVERGDLPEKPGKEDHRPVSRCRLDIHLAIDPQANIYIYYIYIYQDPQGVVNGRPLTSQGLLMDTLSVVLIYIYIERERKGVSMLNLHLEQAEHAERALKRAIPGHHLAIPSPTQSVLQRLEFFEQDPSLHLPESENKH